MVLCWCPPVTSRFTHSSIYFFNVLHYHHILFFLSALPLTQKTWSHFKCIVWHFYMIFFLLSCSKSHSMWVNFRGACHSPAWRMWNPRLVRNRLARYKNQSVSRSLPATDTVGTNPRMLKNSYGSIKLCTRTRSLSLDKLPLSSCCSLSWAEMTVVKD